MKKIFVLFILLPIYVHAASIQINESEQINISGITTITCNGINTTFAETSECCSGQSCENETSIDLSLQKGTCPKLVIDGYLYSLQSDIQLIHTSKTFSISSSNISNCRRADNSFPSVGSLNESNLTTNNVFFGVSNAYIDVDSWRLYITSKDGDLSCSGSEAFVDVIFENSYE
ncbi:hypothetical protein [Marinicella sp. W31]|uniref:hypothetical protein n=1 Tax=Marinicella sp. W31 TaxID=3023713 RepID=UPI0037573189